MGADSATTTQRLAALYEANKQYGALGAPPGDAAQRRLEVVLLHLPPGLELERLHVAAVLAAELLHADVEDEVGAALLAGEGAPARAGGRPALRGRRDGGVRDTGARALQSAREVFGLAVAESVILIGRAGSYADHRQRDGGADDIDRSLDGIGEQPDRVGEPPRQYFERNRHQCRDDRQRCELAGA